MKTGYCGLCSEHAELHLVPGTEAHVQGDGTVGLWVCKVVTNPKLPNYHCFTSFIRMKDVKLSISDF